MAIRAKKEIRPASEKIQKIAFKKNINSLGIFIESTHVLIDLIDQAKPKDRTTMRIQCSITNLVCICLSETVKQTTGNRIYLR